MFKTIGDAFQKVAVWWHRATCSHQYRVARMGFIEEIAFYYWECPVDMGGCGATWDDGT